ncbi:MAG TPA: DnaJ domain-containing protein [Thermoanaerobaculia bacterium]|nr:DnaJ domain-containing protein [Thermoanaerobaculia bacterium]
MDISTHRPTQEELRLFSVRIGQRLDDRPLDLDPSSHQQRVAGLLRQAGEASFYQLLDIVPTATSQEVHEAYDQTARLVHPANARRLGLAGREGVLEMLFERITQGYLILSQPERRKAYDRELAPTDWSAAWNPMPHQRRDEARELAQSHYERATALAEAGELHFAIELLQQAVRADARPEYHALLGRLQAKNPRWLRAASENLRRAIELGAKEPELPAALDQVMERLRAGEALRPDATAGAPASRRKREAPEVEVVDVGDDSGLPFSQPRPPGRR